MSDFFVPLLNGLTIAMTIYVIASGLSLVFGVLGVLNFAHGSLYMCGAFLLFTLMRHVLPPPMGFWVGLCVVPLLVAVLGALLEMALLRFIYKADPLYQLLLTYGLVLIISDVVKLIWGAEHQSVPRPPGFTGSVALWGHLFPSYNLYILWPSGLATMCGLAYVLHRTRLGRLIQAATQDREMLGALGINVRRLYTGVFALGAGLGGLGGVLAAPMGAIYPGMDLDIIIDAFIVVVIGGLGSVGGTVLGAMTFGVLRSFGILFMPQFETLFIFMLMAVVLVVRPQGLLGTHVTSGH